MAKYRQLHTNFWNDGFVLDLTPEEKYFYLYLMTNPNTTQCGIYELPKRIIETQTGYNRDTVDKLLIRFMEYEKIKYCNESKEIMIVNWMKYNRPTSCNAIKCVNGELKNLKCKEYLNHVYTECNKLHLNIKSIFSGLEEYIDAAIPNENEDKEYEQDSLEEVIFAFESNVHALTPIQRDEVVEWTKVYKREVIILAIKEAVNSNVKNIRYIEKILRVWSKKGLSTVEAIQNYMINWRRNKDNRNTNGEREYDVQDLEKKLLGWDNEESLSNVGES